MGIKISHFDLVNTIDLEQKWTELYANSTHNVFLDWDWITAWLHSIPIPPIVIEATYQNKCVGLGLLCRKTSRLFFNKVTIEQLWLHKCGDEKLDQIWIEHNDFLLHSQHEEDTRLALVRHIKHNINHWDEFYLGMSSNTVIQKFEQVLGENRTVIRSSDYEVNLSHLDNLDSYLNGLSKNTRSQILRSKKLLSEQGDIQLRLAQTEQEKSMFFSELSKLHQDKWRNTPMGSGFDNPIFVNIHKHIIFRDTSNRYSGIYSLELNGKSLSFIYLLKTHDSWYFYLSGMQIHPDNKIKIGLLTHALLIQQAINNGIKKYSFLAGDARYKKSMSNQKDGIQKLVCFLKPSKLNYFLQQLRHLKSLLPRLYKNRE